jgi:amino-acid N-acetyltransferase
MTATAKALRVQPAEVGDARAIHELINGYARKGEMLPRTMAEVFENLRDFSVVREASASPGELVACGALHIMWEDLAEVRSLAVQEDRQGQGLGALLVAEHLREAKALGLATVFALTYRPAFFERQGFRQADVMTLPRKVWNECYRCPKFPTCNEIAVVLDLKDAS